MKKNRLFFAVCMAGSLALLASSCKKNDEKEVVISLPQMEEADIDEGRMYIDFNAGNTYKWNGNDEVMFYNLDEEDGTQTIKAIYTANSGAEGQTSASFFGDDLGAKKDHFFVFHPVNMLANGDAALDVDNFETFTVPSTQTYTLIGGKPTVDPTAMACACETDQVKSFKMNHIFGVLRMKLKGVKTVDHIDVIDPAFNLSGNVTMKLHEVNMGTFSSIMNTYANDFGNHEEALASYLQTLGYSSEPTGKVITLNCPGGVQLSENTLTHFFVVLRPGALIKGFKVNVYFTDGDDDSFEYIAENGFDSRYCIKPGVIKSCAPGKTLGQ